MVNLPFASLATENEVFAEFLEQEKLSIQGRFQDSMETALAAFMEAHKAEVLTAIGGAIPGVLNGVSPNFPDGKLLGEGLLDLPFGAPSKVDALRNI